MTKFFVDQHGCAKNRVDGEILATHLTQNGYEITFNPEEAEIIIINSCGFIQSAKEESINAVIQAKSAYPDKKIILAGCLSERYAQMFTESLSEADGIFGNGDLSGIVKVCDEVMKSKRPVLKSPQKGVSSCQREHSFGFKGSQYVKITEGCSNHCSFCAIPNIRGELRSRMPSEILEEIKSLVEAGNHELNLIGQDLAAYGTGVDDGDVRLELSKLTGENLVSRANDFFPENALTPLAALLKLISRVDGDFWVRLLYIHPDHLNFDVLDVMKTDSRFLHYFDIPFQSGSDKIILSMNRKGSFESYKKMISDMRKTFPDLALRTTFLTGFPGEKDEDAQKSEEFLQAIKPAWSGCFPYSREDDTPAYNFKGRISSKKAAARAGNLENLQSKITEEYLQNFVGQILDVLIEEVIPAAHDEDDCFAIGRAWFQAPEVDGAVVVRYDTDEATLCEGDVVKVKVLAVSGIDLDGRVV